MNPQQPQPPITPEYNPQPPAQPQPVAYDAQGNPLYAHPPAQPQPQPLAQPQPYQQPQQTVVHVARAIEPEKQPISPEVQEKHAKSVEAYPELNLSEAEYVIRSVKRHPIGLILPLGFGTLILAALLTLLSGYDVIADNLGLTGLLGSAERIIIPIVGVMVIVGLAMFISWYVYTRNRFFLTNESVIQEIQHSLFSRHEQTVSLGNIEDASFTQRGIMQNILNYGDIRLSTEGDETTYRFSYVMSPRDHIAKLNDAVEAFKNGRPVND